MRNHSTVLKTWEAHKEQTMELTNADIMHPALGKVLLYKSNRMHPEHVLTSLALESVV